MVALRKIFDWLVMSDIYASLIASGIVIITEAVLGLPINALALAAVFFSSLVIYSLNRRDDGDIDSINVPERTMFVAKNGQAILAFATVGFFASFAYAFFVNSLLFLTMAAGFVFGLLYNFPLLRPLEGILGFSRLKEPLAVKNLIVSALYGAFVLAAVFAAHAQISDLAIILVVFIFLRLFIVSTIFDMRDIEGDSKKSIRTIPVTFGKDKSLMFLNGLNLLTLVLGIAAAVFYGTPLFGAMILSTFLYSLYYLEECRKGVDMRYLCSVVVEADFVPALAIALPFVLIHLI